MQISSHLFTSREVRNLPARVCLIAATIVVFLKTFAASSEIKNNVEVKPTRGNLTLGGLFHIHFAGENGGCAKTFSYGGLKEFAAMLFAVNRINADQIILPNINLGVQVFDTCKVENIAMDRVLKEFVLGTCSDHGSCSSELQRPVIGVVGPATSVAAVLVAKALAIFKIPLISYSATSPKLSDKSDYEYFSRTTPSDAFQTQVMAELLEYFNWSYVSVVYTDEPYGRSGNEYFKKEAKKRGICIAVEGKLPNGYDEDKYKDLVTKLIDTKSANVVVLFCTEKSLTGLFREMRKKAKDFEKMQFVSAESIRNARLEGLQDIKAKFIYTTPMAKSVREFDKYFCNRNAVNAWKAWFKDFDDQAMNCSLLHEDNSGCCNSSDTFGTKRSLSTGGGDFSGRVIDAVYAFAYALRAIREKSCANGTTPNCEWLGQVSGDLLLRALRNVSFKSPTGRHVRFNKDGDVTVREYTMYYLQRNAKDNDFSHVKIGEWKSGGRINLTKSSTQKFASVKSRCSEPCGAHKIQSGIPEKESSCCWKCEYCPRDSFLLNKTHCQACQKGFLPNQNGDACVKIKPIYYGVSDSVSLWLVVPPLCLSVLGIFAVAFIVCVFVKFNNTPLVKASARELSSVLLGGVFLSYLFPLVCIFKPSTFKCFLEFILNSITMTISYVAIAVKTNRVFRIFDENRSSIDSPHFIRPLSQILLSLVLILFQVLLLVVLVVLDCPTKKLVYVSSTEVHLVCSTSDSYFFLSQLYNCILIAACTYYSYKARNIPRNFNETKYIAFAMYGSCVLVLAFLVVSFVLMAERFGEIHKTAVRCYSIVLTSTVLVTCIFAPKLRIILFKPKDNVNQPIVISSTNMVEIRPHNKTPNEDGSSSRFFGTGDIRERKKNEKIENLVQRSNRSTQTE